MVMKLKILAVQGGVFPGCEAKEVEIPKEAAMLIRYSCKDMGLNCTFSLKGETVEEVTQKALEHIQEKHSDDFNNLTSPAQVQVMLKALARSTRVVVG